MRVRLHDRLPFLIERATNRVRFFGGGTSSTNTIQNTTPWSGQQPSLESLFAQAGNLNAGPGPQYYPNQQVAPLNDQQWNAINALEFQGNNGTPALNASQGAVSNITGGQTNLPAVGNYGLANSALSSELSGAGIGGMVPAYTQMQGTLGNLAGAGTTAGAQGGFNAGESALQGLAGYQGNNPAIRSAISAIPGMASGAGVGQASGGFYQAEKAIQDQAGGGPLNAAVPLASQGSSALQNIASGASNQDLNASQASTLSQFTDPSKALTGSIAASVLPQIESQFGAAGGMSNPNAAYAASQGLASALAPYGLQAAAQAANLGMTEQGQRLQAGQTGLSNLSQQMALQQGAAGLGTQAMQAQQGLEQGAAGLGLQAQQAQFGANQAGAGLGVSALGQQEQAQLGATGQTNQAMLAQQALQAQSAQQASQNYLQGQGQQLVGAQIAPSLNAATMGNLQSALGAAGMPQQLQQQQIDALMQQWNFNQMQPYNKLGLFQGEVGGTGYGSSSTLQQPYFNNTGGQLLSGATGIGSMLGQTGAFGNTGWLTGALGLGGPAATGVASAADLAALAGVSTAAEGGIATGGMGASLLGLGGIFSLRKYKENITPLRNALDEVMQLEPVEFNWKPEISNDPRPEIGFIAEDAAAVDPRLGFYDTANPTVLRSVKYAQMTALLVAALQELKYDNDDLRSQINELRNALT